jgi:hypothetical protein
VKRCEEYEGFQGSAGYDCASAAMVPSHGDAKSNYSQFSQNAISNCDHVIPRVEIAHEKLKTS